MQKSGSWGGGVNVQSNSFIAIGNQYYDNTYIVLYVIYMLMKTLLF
jgi:hypothetical protein